MLPAGAASLPVFCFAAAPLPAHDAVAMPSVRTSPSAIIPSCFVMFNLAVWLRLQSLSSVLRKPASAAGVPLPRGACDAMPTDRRSCGARGGTTVIERTQWVTASNPATSFHWTKITIRQFSQPTMSLAAMCDPRFVGGTFALAVLTIFANCPFIARLNLNGLHGFCKPGPTIQHGTHTGGSFRFSPLVFQPWSRDFTTVSGVAATTMKILSSSRISAPPAGPGLTRRMWVGLMKTTLFSAASTNRISVAITDLRALP